MYYYGNSGLQSTKLLDQFHFIVIGHSLCHMTLIERLLCVKRVANLIINEKNLDKTQPTFLVQNLT